MNALVPQPKLNPQQAMVDLAIIRRQVLNEDRYGKQVRDLSEDVSRSLKTYRWRRLEGLARFWEADGFAQVEGAGRDAYSGLHAMLASDVRAARASAALVLGSARRVAVFLGVSGTAASSTTEQTASLFRGCFPGLRVSAEVGLPAGLASSRPALLSRVGCLIGIPGSFGSIGSARTDASDRVEAGIDRVLRGMGQVEWGYLVEATPRARSETRKQIDQLGKHHTDASAYRRMTGQTTHSPKDLTVDLTSQSIYQETTTLSYEAESREVRALSEILDGELGRVERGMSLGMWRVNTTFFSNDEGIARLLGGLLCAAFRPYESSSEPLTFVMHTVGEAKGLGLRELATDLVSDELAAIACPPTREVAGYYVTDHVVFDTDMSHASAIPIADRLEIGEIVDEHGATVGPYLIPRVSLTKHALVVGVTGSGKTTTVVRLLHSLAKTGAEPTFLVIEPAKTEYRRLLGHPTLGDRLVVYTPGKEDCVPFRLNPFEFDAVMRDGARNATLVQSHIDSLRAAFNAAFILYAPMPYVLDMALHEVYRDKGWDIATSGNARLFRDVKPAQVPEIERRYPVFPTLTDLRAKIVDVANRLGYESRIQMDVTAGLQARIDSLRLGAKGLMFDVDHGIPIEQLLSKPTVIELEALGNDDEKAFLMGLLMARIFEYRRLEGFSGGLRHVTVVEEAHRILRNVDTDVGTEESNNRAAAVGVFANMLSESRAYGESLVFCEQIPSKLAQDVVKNTNLKLLHRLVSSEDRETMAAAMNLKDAQLPAVVTLEPARGGTIAFSEGDDRPYRVLVEPVTGFAGDPPTDRDIADKVQSRVKPQYFEPAPQFNEKVGASVLPARVNLPRLRSAAREYGDDLELWSALQRCFYSFAEGGLTTGAVDGVAGRLTLLTRNEPAEAVPPLRNAILCRAVDLMVNRIAQIHAVRYADAESLRAAFLNLLTSAVALRANGKPLASDTQARSQAFRDTFRPTFAANFGPYAICDRCAAKCRFRAVAVALLDSGVEAAINGALERKVPGISQADHLRGVSEKLRAHTQGYASLESEVKGLALCLGVNFVRRQPYSEAAQRDFLDAVLP